MRVCVLAALVFFAVDSGPAIGAAGGVQDLAEWVASFNQENAAAVRFSQKYQLDAPLEIRFLLNNTSAELLRVVSPDARSLELTIGEGLDSEVGHEFVRHFIRTMKKSYRPNPGEVAQIARNAALGSKRSEALLLDIQLKALDSFQPRAGSDAEVKAVADRLKEQFGRSLLQATREYERGKRQYLARVSSASDDELRATLWALLKSSDREGLVRFFSRHLPWEMMLPTDVAIWKSWLASLTVRDTENDFLYYRGLSQDYAERGPAAIMGGLFPESSYQLQLAWPLRKFLNKELPFADLVGVEPPGTFAQYRETFGTKSLLHNNILYKLVAHSGGTATSKPLESPLLSTSTSLSVAGNFSKEGHSSGVLSVWKIAPARMFKAPAGRVTEREVLAPLFLLPDELVLKVSARGLPHELDARVTQGLIKAGEHDRLRQFDGNDALSLVNASFCQERFASVSP
ncbi:MAG: hypothetical protein NDJ89_04895 [Oligoflexia bacterium]|nr:hypothetical protein [Oligoflexia bacterium]